MGNGRHVDFMEGNVGVCLPSAPQSLGKDQSRTSRDHSGSTVVAETHLVTRLTRIECGAPRALTLLEKLLMQPKLVVYHRNL